MKSKEEIISDSIKLEVPPNDYSLVEIHCFLALKQLLIMYHNKQISSSNATKTKKLILADYEKKSRQYEFDSSVYQEHIKHLKDTELLRTELRKKLNDNKEKTEQELYEIINLAVEILATVFKGEFITETEKEDTEIMTEMAKIVPFMKAAQEAIKEPDKRYEFECPICKGKAFAGKAGINGHIRAHCNKCKIQIMQ